MAILRPRPGIARPHPIGYRVGVGVRRAQGGVQAATIGEVLAVQTGSVSVPGLEGVQAATIASPAQSAAGAVLVQGAQAATIPNLTPNAAGTVEILGVQAATIASPAQSAAGTVVTVTPSVIFGSDLLYWYEVDAATITEAAGVASALADRSAGAYHLTTVAGKELTYNASGGPGGRAYLSFPGLDRYLKNSAINVAAGERLSFWTLAVADSTSQRTAFQAHVTNETGNQLFMVHALNPGGGQKYFQRANFQTAGLQSLTITSPAHTTGWRRFEQHYDATATVSKIDETDVSPAYSTGTGQAASGMQYVEIGNKASSLGGGKFHLAVCARVSSAAQRTAMTAYLQAIGT